MYKYKIKIDGYILADDLDDCMKQMSYHFKNFDREHNCVFISPSKLDIHAIAKVDNSGRVIKYK